MGIKDQPKFFDWQTPPDMVDLIHQAFDTIVLDPATSADNPTRAQFFYAPTPPVGGQASGWLGPCGLRGEWGGRDRDGLLYANFRYGKFLGGKIDPAAPVVYDKKIIGYGTGWAAKLAEDRGEWLTVVPCSSDSLWWRVVEAQCSWRVDTAQRLSFFDPRTGKIVQGNKAGSTWFYRGPRVANFRRWFAIRGTEAPSTKLVRETWGFPIPDGG